MRKRSGSVLVGAILVLSGCYHATIDTGRTSSGQTVENEWAHGFVYGLVPPSTVEVAEDCPNGVATVETELSFLNQVASALTFGIYTPMTITVQCAAAAAAMNGTEVRVDPTATMEEAREVLVRAAKRSASEGEPVTVRFLSE